MTLEVLGWVVSAVVGFLLSEARQWWRDKRDRQTLVQALSAEIEQNAKVTETIEARYSGRDLKNMINDPDLSSMSNDRWRDSQGKTHLLPPQLGEVLQRYYSAVQTLLTFLNFRRDKRSKSPYAPGPILRSTGQDTGRTGRDAAASRGVS